MKIRKRLKKFIKAINQYNKGKSPKGLRVYESNRGKKKREIIDLDEVS